MSKMKKTLAVLLAAALLLTCSACSFGKDTRIAMTIGDTDIPAGLYTLFMIDAQQEAINKINEADSTDSEDATEASSETTEATKAPDYYSLKVENKDFSEWVQEKAVESCKKYVAVNNLFTELSLTLTVDDQQVLESSVTNYWEPQKDKLQKAGVSEDSFRLYTEYGLKQNAIFNAYYGEGGSREVPENDILTGLIENFATVKALSVGKTNTSTGEAYDSDVVAKLKSLCDTCSQRLNNGEAFDDVKAYFDAQVTLITTGVEPTTAAATEPATGTEDTTGTTESTTQGTTEYDSSVIVVSKESIESGGNTAKLISAVFDSEVNKASVVELDSEMHVIIRVGDISNNPYYVKTYSNNVLQLLKSDEMNAEFDSLAGSLKETLNDKAIKRYPVKKLEGFRS